MHILTHTVDALIICTSVALSCLPRCTPTSCAWLESSLLHRPLTYLRYRSPQVGFPFSPNHMLRLLCFARFALPFSPLFTPHTSHTLRAASHVPPLRPAPCRRNYGPTIPRTHHIRRPHLSADVLLPISRPATGLVPNEDHFGVSIFHVRYRILRATPPRSLEPTPLYIRLPG